MYEQSARWNEYYRELEPQRRREMLAELIASEPDDGANAYRQRLFEARCVDPKAPGKLIDRFLFQCVNFMELYRSAKLFRRGAAKEVRRELRNMRFDEAVPLGEAGERALYWEIRNAAARYFRTCDSPGYNRALFGLVASGAVSKQDRMCRDAWQMSTGLARRVGLEDEMALWTRAVLDAYAAADPDAQARLEAVERKAGK